MKKYALAKTDPLYGTGPQSPQRTYVCGAIGPGMGAPTYSPDLAQAAKFDSAQEAQDVRTLYGLAGWTVHEIDGQMVQDLGI